MSQIEIIANGIYLPDNKIGNEELTKRFSVCEKTIFDKTGIKNRYYTKEENIEDIAIGAVNDLIKKIDINVQEIGLVLVTSTSSDRIMPGISFKIQKELGIKECMCFDLLAGCSGYINAFDIAKMYIENNKVKYALIIGCETLRKYTNPNDFSTTILFSDGAGATLIGKTNEDKRYASLIQSDGTRGDLLKNSFDGFIEMDGKGIYKYAVTDTVKNIKQLLKREKIDIKEIKYIVPHQSNIRILKQIAERLNISINKMYINLEQIGNTFCASIPIALNEMFEKNIIKSNDKILLLGYGGGLNLGSILLEV